MSGRLAQSFIDELLRQTDIVELISEAIPLKKAGTNFLALCPFHDEKTPSFTVSASKQFYHCFGCGVNGSAIGFVMAYRNLTFPDAVAELAERASMTLPHADNARQSKAQHPDLSAVLTRASAIFQQALRQHPAAKTVIAYLKKRGLSGQICKQYGIGFAPPGWDNLQNAFQDDPANQALLRDAGLVIHSDNNKVYDRFRHRIMFPIRNRRGQVIAFGGRVLDDSMPKYLNSPETPLFHKSSELYGWYEAFSHVPTPERLIVVEGYMDVLALAQHGIPHVVATLGTAISKEHAQRILRALRQVVFCFDGDSAGQKAAFRALECTLALVDDQHDVFFMFLPDGEDPDSLVRKEGNEGFSKRLAQAQTLSHYFVQSLCEKADLTQLDGRAKLVKLAVPYLQSMQQTVRRHLLIEQIAVRARVDVAYVRQLVTAGQKRGAQAAADVGKSIDDEYALASARLHSFATLPPVYYAMSLLLQFPQLALSLDSLHHMAMSVRSPEGQLLVELLKTAKDKPGISTAGLLEQWRGQDSVKLLAKLATKNSILPEENMHQEFVDVIAQWQKDERDLENQALVSKAQQAGLAGLSDDEKARLKQILHEQEV